MEGELERQQPSVAPVPGAPRPRLLYFFSPTDGPSRRVESYLANVLQGGRNHETFEVLRIDVKRRPDLAERFHITVLPTILVADERTIRSRLEGPKNAQVIKALLAPWLRR